MKQLLFSIISMFLLSPAAMAQTRASDSTPKAPEGATYTLSDGSTVTKSNETLSSETQYYNVVQVTKGTLNLNDCTLSKTGTGTSGDNSSFYGNNSALYASGSNSSVNMTGGSIITSSKGANAVFATNNATITVSDITIDNSQSVSRGLHATFGGTINASNVNITTRKDTSSTVATDRGGGTVMVSGGTLTAMGDKSAVLYSTGVITANNLTGVSEKGPIVTVEGANYAYVNDCQMTSGSSKRGILLHQSNSGDAEGTKPYATITNSSLTLTDSNAPLCYVENCTATLTLTDVTLKVPSGLLMSVPNSSKGNGSTGTIVLETTKNSWEYAGTVDTGTENKVAVTVGENVTWTLTADTYVTTLINNGVINKNGYSLTYGSLSGNGIINESTGINEVRQTTIDSNAPAYTLNGTRAGPSTKGIIINNGKKVAIK